MRTVIVVLILVVFGIVVLFQRAIVTRLKRFRNWLFLQRHQGDIVTLYKSFIDPKYPTTGIAQTKENLMQFAKLNGWSAKRFNRVFNYCVRMNIIQDQPYNPKRNRNSKQFFYILNPEYL